jgi:hypothetical protein
VWGFGKEATEGKKIGIPPPILKWIENELFRIGELAEFSGLLGSGGHRFVDED